MEESLELGPKYLTEVEHVPLGFTSMDLLPSLEAFTALFTTRM